MELVAVIGDVGSEIGVAAVGLAQRPVDVVAEARGAEQRLRARLPIFGRRLAARRVEDSGVGKAAFVKPLERVGDFAAGDQLALGRKPVHADAERRQIVADGRHHRLEGGLAADRQPLRLGRVLPARAVARRERFAYRLEIRAGIEARRNGARVLAERPEVAPMDRSRQGVDLRPGVVHVILAGHRVAREFEEVGERVADTAPRAWPICIGPVGLAETYSTLTRRPAPKSERP